ncbi:MAG TPA: chitobiase/beta-hexosaminidase C-terminal domain-containing protein [Candidatus Cloacimonadota bacterium]|nr:chitobiase/beta-hexosaminidase C-terminal domain-containing protein [Candidatus Cloacimonadota bacterium]
MKKTVQIAVVVIILSILLGVMGCNNTTEDNKVATPIFTPPGGTYNQPQTVSITCATEGAEIRYTLDGNDPPSNSFVYTGPITAELGTIIKAMAMKPGHDDSDIATAQYESDHPLIIGNCQIQGTANKVAVSGNYAYVIGSYQGITIINIENKRNPVVVGYHSLPDTPEYIAASDNTVFITYTYPQNPGGTWTKLTAIDVTNHLLPQTIDSISWSLGYATFTVNGQYAYLIGSSLKIVDISNPNNLNEVGSCSPSAFGAKDIVVNGNIAFAAINGSFEGVRAYNISDPNNPSQIGSRSIDGANDIYAEGNYVYLSTGSGGLKIIDASTPSSMTVIATCSTSSYLTKSSDYIFTLDTSRDLSIINVADPTQPQVVQNLITPGASKELCTKDTYLYVADDDMGLQIYDIGMLINHNLPVIKHRTTAMYQIK